jgi:hypothetical protein
MKYENLCWNVLLLESGELSFNIFNSCSFKKYLMDLKARNKQGKVEDLREEIRRGLYYSFGGKAEYEIICYPLLGFSHEGKKVDVYTQVYQNFNMFYTYLLGNWEAIETLTYRQQKNRGV